MKYADNKKSAKDMKETTLRTFRHYVKATSGRVAM